VGSPARHHRLIATIRRDGGEIELPVQPGSRRLHIREPLRAMLAQRLAHPRALLG